MTGIRSIDISLLRVNGGTQSRAQINREVVADYAEAIEAGAEFPPLVVFYDGSSYWLADGFHRYEAYARVNAHNVPAEVRQGTQREAILFSVGANASHGLRRTNDDKRRAVMVLLNDPEWSAWSDREIARQCGAGNQMVSQLRKSICVNHTDKTRTVQRNGTTYQQHTANIGAKRDAEAPEAARANFDPMSVASHLPPAIQEIEAKRREAIAAKRSGVGNPALGGLTAEDRIAELEEAVRVLEAENEALKAENNLFSEMKIQYDEGGYFEVIAGRDEQIRVLETRVYSENQDKISWKNSSDFWKREAMKLGWQEKKNAAAAIDMSVASEIDPFADTYEVAQ